MRTLAEMSLRDGLSHRILMASSPKEISRDIDDGLRLELTMKE